jgi:hypothetical protein
MTSSLRFPLANQILIVLIMLSLPICTIAQDSLNVSLAGTFSIWGHEVDVEIVYPLAYVSTSNGIRVLDITDLDNIEEVGVLEGPDRFTPWDMTFHNNLLYCKHWNTIEAYSITDTLTATLLTSYTNPNRLLRLVFHDSYAFLSVLEIGILVVDLTDPQSFDIITRYQFPVDINNIIINDNILYGNSYDYIYSADISDIYNPVFIDGKEFYGILEGISNDILYFTYDFDLYLAEYDSIDDPESYVRIYEHGLVRSFQANGSTILFSATFPDYDYTMINYFDVQDQTNPQLIMAQPLPDYILDVHFHGRYMSFSSSSNKLYFTDLTSLPDEPSFGSLAYIDGWFNDLFMNGNTVYQVTNDSMLVLNITNQSNPMYLGKFSFDESNIRDMKFRDDIGFILNNEYLYIVDLSDPVNPNIICEYSGPSDPTYINLLLDGDYLYLFTVDNFIVLDILDLENPVQLTDLTQRFFDPYLDGDFIHCLWNPSVPKFRSINISDPVNPVMTPYNMFLDITSMSMLVYEDDIAYITAENYSGESILAMIDVSDPYDTSVLCTYPFEESSTKFEIHAGFIYSTEYPNKLIVTDVRDSMNPVTSGYYDLANDDFDNRFVSFVGDAGKVVASTMRETFIFNTGVATPVVEEPDVLCHQSFNLSPAYPNPFNSATEFAFELPSPGCLSVIAYNISGQRVAELADGSFNAGTHRFTFDASGMASGLYIVRATVPGHFEQTRKVLLVR